MRPRRRRRTRSRNGFGFGKRVIAVVLGMGVLLGIGVLASRTLPSAPTPVVPTPLPLAREAAPPVPPTAVPSTAIPTRAAIATASPMSSPTPSAVASPRALVLSPTATSLPRVDPTDIQRAFAQLGPDDGAVLVDPRGTLRVEHNADSVFDGASLLKLLLVAQVFQDGESGRLDWHSTVQVTPDSIYPGTGILQLDVGARPNTALLTRLMIYHSDNTAADFLLDDVGIDRVNALGETLGLRHTHLGRKFGAPGDPGPNEEKTTTPGDMAHLLDLVANDGLVSPESSASIRDLLKVRAAIDPWWIPLAAPPNWQTWHLTGRVDGNRHDATLVQLPDGREYVLVIMTNSANTPEANRADEQRITDTACAVFAVLDAGTGSHSAPSPSCTEGDS